MNDQIRLPNGENGGFAADDTEVAPCVSGGKSSRLGTKAADTNELQSLIIVAGVCGSGKTAALNLIETTRYLRIDVTTIGKSVGLAEYDEGSYTESAKVIEESMNKAITENRHVIYESQLTHFSLIDRAIRRVIENHGLVHIAYIDIDAVTAVVRTSIRELSGQSNLKVPNEAIIFGYNHSLPTFLELQKQYRHHSSVTFSARDNNVDSRNPVLVFTEGLPFDERVSSSLHARTVMALEEALENINPHKGTIHEARAGKQESFHGTV